MNRRQIFDTLNGIFRDIFDDPALTVGEETTALLTPAGGQALGWDSLTHITLLAAVEDEFGITFAMKDVVEMKNVGDMASAIEAAL